MAGGSKIRSEGGELVQASDGFVCEEIRKVNDIEESSQYYKEKTTDLILLQTSRRKSLKIN